MNGSQRVAIVGGVRTPFVKAGTVFQNHSFQDLGTIALSELVKRYVAPEDAARPFDEFAFGSVLLDPRTPNWAREILFAAKLPKDLYAYAVSNNCISGLVAITSIAERISLGLIRTGAAGGAESMSNPALLFGRQASRIFLEAGRARSVSQRLKAFAKLRLRHFAPQAPSPKEPSTGLTMGQHMEITAQQLNIPRQAQDELALASHKNAAQATADGRLTEDIVTVDGVTKDLLIRADTTLEKLSQLKPAFDRSERGTLTAGNSSALTDGASVVLLMSEEEAKRRALEPIAFIRAYEYAAIDPAEGLLMAPASCVPRLLERTRLSLCDFDLIEVHEAFAAQVLANLQAWEKTIGTVDRSKLNVMGGSIAIGHPFAATGGRMVLGLARELRRRKARRGLISICAAGAMAGAMILEV